jgi:hypothetical protein
MKSFAENNVFEMISDYPPEVSLKNKKVIWVKSLIGGAEFRCLVTQFKDRYYYTDAIEDCYSFPESRLVRIAEDIYLETDTTNRQNLAFLKNGEIILIHGKYENEPVVFLYSIGKINRVFVYLQYMSHKDQKIRTVYNWAKVLPRCYKSLHYRFFKPYRQSKEN